MYTEVLVQTCAHQPWACCFNLQKFTGAFLHRVNLESFVSLVFSILFGSYTLFAYFSLGLPEPYGKDIYSHLLQEEATLMMARQDTDLWVQQNVSRSHSIAFFFLELYFVLFFLCVCVFVCLFILDMPLYYLV